LISGAVPPSSGDIVWLDQNVNHLPISQRVPLGLARTFQTTSLLAEFSVLDQVFTACHTSYRVSAWRSVLRTKDAKSQDAQQLTKAQELVEFVGLGEVMNDPTSTISSAQQRLLMIATAMASDPKLILLDEPAAGMVAKERKELADVILRIRARGLAVLVIEHHMGLIMEVCDLRTFSATRPSLRLIWVGCIDAAHSESDRWLWKSQCLARDQPGCLRA
jgi:ABC-type branched-subunit amino acid transport system ATPase component